MPALAFVLQSCLPKERLILATVDRCQLLNFVHHEGLSLTVTDRLEQ